MSTAGGPALAHRSVATIRSSSSQTGISSPHTPPRALSASFGSPSSIRADDDFVLIEIGSRFIRAGFAGDSLPKACLTCGPEVQRRGGDFRIWQNPLPTATDAWSSDYEVWRYDLRDFDLDLFQDQLDRVLRDAFTRFLLIDSRPRRMGLVLDPSVPIPLLSSVLDTLFTNFQAPMISLMSSQTMAAVGAGARSALVVDMGWKETVVTSVYEYREVKSTRSVRGAKSLIDELYKLLLGLMPDAGDDDSDIRAVSFEECEDILCRLMWCRASAFKSSQRQSAQLDTVEEQDENEAEQSQPSGVAEIPLRSTSPPSTLHVPFNKLADICDDAFFDPSASPATFDDHELPLHLLVYQHLLQLPLDVRATCMSRIIFTGGCSNILGIKERILDEITSIIDRRGWAPVFGKSVENQHSNGRLNRRDGTQRSSTSSVATTESGGGDDSDGIRSDYGNATSQEDIIEAKIARNRPIKLQYQGQLRAIHSLGAWAGASLLCQLKVPAMATIDRELWLQQGANGASRPNEVDVKAQQRQSMGAGGLIRGSGGHHTNWTLGVWGNL